MNVHSGVARFRKVISAHDNVVVAMIGLWRPLHIHTVRFGSFPQAEGPEAFASTNIQLPLLTRSDISLQGGD